MRQRFRKIWGLYAVATLILISVRAAAAQSFDISGLKHTPPEITAQSLSRPLQLEIPGKGIRRARVLVATAQGYRAFEMKMHDEKFRREVLFGDLTVLKYQFQIESDDGRLHESAYFTLRQPLNGEAENALANLEQEAALLESRALQLENSLYAARKADPAVLARNKNQEFARALVVSGQKERLLSEASSDLQDDLTALEEMLASETPREADAEVRKFLEGARKFMNFKQHEDR